MGKPSNSTQDLHTAARSGDLVAVQTICSSNPLAVNSRDKHSRTPLHLAAWAGQAQVVNFLRKNKADVGASAMDDMGAIHFAAQKGHLEVVKTLVSSGVSLKSTNRKGMTPLHYAVQGSHIDLIKYLVKKGSNINSKNKAGKTPLDLANNEQIRSLLNSKEQDENSTKLTEESQTKDIYEEKSKGSKGEDDVEESQTKDVSKEKSKGSKGEDDIVEKNDETVKRKAEEEDVPMEVTKKARVALNHLLTSDDTQEDEDQNGQVQSKPIVQDWYFGQYTLTLMHGARTDTVRIFHGKLCGHGWARFVRHYMIVVGDHLQFIRDHSTYGYFVFIYDCFLEKRIYKWSPSEVIVIPDDDSNNDFHEIEINNDHVLSATNKDMHLFYNTQRKDLFLQLFSPNSLISLPLGENGFGTQNILVRHGKKTSLVTSVNGNLQGSEWEAFLKSHNVKVGYHIRLVRLVFEVGYAVCFYDYQLQLLTYDWSPKPHLKWWNNDDEDLVSINSTNYYQ